MVVKIFPKHPETSSKLAGFLRLHYFSISSFKDNTHFVSVLSSTPGAIDTLEALTRLANETKVHPALEFFFEEDKHEQ